MADRAAAYLTPGPDTRLEDEHADTHRVLAPFGYYSAILEREVWVPADFQTDWASVPKWPLFFLMLGGKGKRAALIHDYLYTIGEIGRDLCDAVFREALTLSGYSGLTVGLFYGGVRIGGESRYNAPNVPQEPHVTAAMLEAP